MKNSGYLLPETRTVLEKLAASVPDLLRHTVLAGGSALALHLGHRQSEDLDFITFENWFDRKQILDVMKFFDRSELLHESGEQVDLLLNGIKVTIFNAGWEFLRPGKPAGPVHLASLEQLVAMKIHTLFVRARFRDYYDLYVMARECFTLPEMYDHASRILEGINFKLFSIALVYTDDIEDDSIAHLSPRYQITKEEISEYFVTELKKLRTP